MVVCSSQEFRGLSICAGIGGLDLGLKIACPEYRTVCHVEREAYAAAVLVKRMEEGWLDPAPVWDDLSTFKGHCWRGKVDMVTAGLPCQPYSVAGRQQGDKDERYIWPEFFRIVREVQPPLVFLENVPGLLAWFRPIGEELSGMGYQFEAGLFSAAEVGASHKRERLFILAHSKVSIRGRATGTSDSRRGTEETGRPSRVPVGNTQCEGLEGNGDGRTAWDTSAFPPGPGDRGAWAAILREWPGLAPAVDDSQIRAMRVNSQNKGAPDRDGDSPDDTNTHMENPTRDTQVRSPRKDGRSRGVGASSQALPDTKQRQETQPAVRRVANGLPNRVDRLRACGNGVVPLTAAWAFVNLARKLGLNEHP